MVLCVPLMLRSCRLTTQSCYQLRAFLDNSKTVKSKLNFSRTLHVTLNLSSSAAQNLERRYTDKHEWVTSDGKIGTVGISQYAQDALGDVVYAQLPEIGSQIEQNEECGALESVKAASELYSPVSGKVIEVNSAVEATPGLINQSCYEKGWLFKVELSKKDEVSALMNQIDYDKFLKSDPH